MSEIKRIVRYTLPGIIFLFVLTVSVYVSGDISFKRSLLSVIKGGGIVSVLAFLFGTGAVGYLFSMIYFFLRRSISCYFFDHVPPLLFLCHNYKLVIKAGEDNSKLSKADAWTILNYLWHANMEENNVIGKVDGLVDRLCDVVHGIGATFIGICFAVIAWVFFACFQVEICGESVVIVWKNVVILVGYAVLLLLVYRQYMHTKCDVENLVNTVLVSHLMEKDAGTEVVLCRQPFKGDWICKPPKPQTSPVAPRS